MRRSHRVFWLLVGLACALPSANSQEKPSSPGKASRDALTALEKYLAKAPEARPDLMEQSFASVPLTRSDAAAAARLLWQDLRAQIERDRKEEHKKKSITLNGHTLRFDFSVYGDPPPEGRSLYISLHGGGGAPAYINDQQWENQKYLYQPKEGIYLAPRAPTNTWDLWHQGHIDPLFDRLITNFIVFEGVNPNRVYLMGYSAGGDGVYQLAPRMADRWAAAAMMAGHPNEASPLGLRNIGFTLHVGALDSAYQRNTVAKEWAEKLAALRKEDPEGYAHEVHIHKGKGHWMDLADAVAVDWMAAFTRTPLPEYVVWKQDDVTHARFYWLAVDPKNEKEGAEVRARRNGQNIEIEKAEGIDALTILLSDDMLDLDLPIKVTAQGKELFSGTVPRTISTLARTLQQREDPSLVFSAEVLVSLPKKSAP